MAMRGPALTPRHLSHRQRMSVCGLAREKNYKRWKEEKGERMGWGGEMRAGSSESAWKGREKSESREEGKGEGVESKREEAGAQLSGGTHARLSVQFFTI